MAHELLIELIKAVPGLGRKGDRLWLTPGQISGAKLRECGHYFVRDRRPLVATEPNHRAVETPPKDRAMKSPLRKTQQW